MSATLEHVNFTVPDPLKTAKWLCDLFDWQIRWQGDSIYNGTSVHVGSKDSYFALYSGVPGKKIDTSTDTYSLMGGMNHIGIVVDDLDAIETKVKALGFTPNSHADYEPGRRFYFDDDDGVEYEIVSYA